MLENARNYLKNYLNKVNEYIREIREDNDKKNKEYESGMQLLIIQNEKRLAKRSCIYLTLFALACIGGLVSGVTLGNELLIQLCTGLCIPSTVFTAISYKRLAKTNRKFKNAYEQSEYPFKTLIKDETFDYNRFFRERYIKPMSRNKDRLASWLEDLDNLYSILTSDDFVKEVADHCDYWYCIEALKSEWDAYLEEVSQMKLQDIDLEVSDIKEEVLNSIKKYSLTKNANQENKINLSIK